MRDDDDDDDDDEEEEEGNDHLEESRHHYTTLKVTDAIPKSCLAWVPSHMQTPLLN